MEGGRGILDAARTAYDSEAWADYTRSAEESIAPSNSSLLVRATDRAAIQSIKARVEEVSAR
jgi:hypothetical protein